MNLQRWIQVHGRYWHWDHAEEKLDIRATYGNRLEGGDDGYVTTIDWRSQLGFPVRVGFGRIYGDSRRNALRRSGDELGDPDTVKEILFCRFEMPTPATWRAKRSDSDRVVTAPWEVLGASPTAVVTDMVRVSRIHYAIPIATLDDGALLEGYQEIIESVVGMIRCDALKSIYDAQARLIGDLANAVAEGGGVTWT
jgi:hypothetical protein